MKKKILLLSWVLSGTAFAGPGDTVSSLITQMLEVAKKSDSPTWPEEMGLWVRESAKAGVTEVMPDGSIRLTLLNRNHPVLANNSILQDFAKTMEQVEKFDDLPITLKMEDGAFKAIDPKGQGFLFEELSTAKQKEMEKLFQEAKEVGASKIAGSATHVSPHVEPVKVAGEVASGARPGLLKRLSGSFMKGFKRGMSTAAVGGAILAAGSSSAQAEAPQATEKSVEDSGFDRALEESSHE